MTDLEVPPIVGGRYRVVRPIGQGGMGAVYEVEHVHTGEFLALKLLTARGDVNRAGVERFKLEARVSAQIRSEHVVRITDADISLEAGGAPYVVMELLVGSDLERQAGSTPQSPDAVVTWLRQAARALDKAHRLQIIHRDLKPANLFLTTRDDGSPLLKILDFGIAKLLDDGAGTTTTGEVVGTPLYMAPEHARGDEALTGAADRFALGLIAYRLLFGRPYWRKTNVTQILHELLYAPMDPPSARESRLGAPFDRWFERALARDPAARFGSAAAQVEALAEAVGVPTRPIPSDPIESVPSPDGASATDAGAAATPATPARSVAPSSASRDSAGADVGPTLQLAASTMATDPARRTRAPWIAGAIALVAAGAFVGALIASLRSGARSTAASPATVASEAPAVPTASIGTATTIDALPQRATPLASPHIGSPAASGSSNAPPSGSAPPAVRSPRNPAPKASASAARPSPAPPAPTVDPFADQK